MGALVSSTKSNTPAFWQCPKCKTPNPWASYLTHCVACGGPRPAKAAAVAFEPRHQVAPTPAKPAPSARALSAVSWGYLALVLIVLAVVKLLGERWWPATILMFSPRWAFLFPGPILAVWAFRRKRWSPMAVQAIAMVVVLVPLMGLRMPIARLFAPAPGGERVRILSLNRGTSELDSKAFTQLVAEGKYDFVCIQEFRADLILDNYFANTGWHRNHDGSIWSRLPIVEDLGSLPTDEFEVVEAWPVRLSMIRVRLKKGREVVVANAHLPTMTSGFLHLAKGDLQWFRYYVDWRRRQTDRLIAELRRAGDNPVIVAGDFNMPPDSPFMKTIRTTFASGFETVGWGYGYTRPSRLSWAGIDRVLATLDCQFISSRVGPLVGSDHRPIDAELAVPDFAP